MFRELAFLGAFAMSTALAGPAEDEKTIAQLDTEYQLAVKNHDVAAIVRIHADDMILVLGNGRVVTGHAPRNVASRNALAATWCASMRPAVVMATRQRRPRENETAAPPGTGVGDMVS